MLLEHKTANKFAASDFIPDLKMRGFHPPVCLPCEQYDPLEAVIRSAFDAARRQLVKLSEKQRDEVKSHPEQEMGAVVTKLFPEQDYGFFRALDSDEEIYFHRNSVIHDDFDRIEVGTGVRYVALQDEEGLLRATTVQIVDKPGANISQIDEEAIEQPLGWK